MKKLIISTVLILFPTLAQAYQATGVASYYNEGQRTANGESFNPQAMTAAHRTLPFGTKVRVTNKRNGKSVIVRINDRGPFNSRIIDLSEGAARAISMGGTTIVEITTGGLDMPFK